MSGSYALGIATKLPQARELYEVIAHGLRAPPDLEELQSRFGVSPCLDRVAYRSLMSLAADAGIDMEFSFLPRGSTTFESSVSVERTTTYRVLDVLGSTHETEGETVLHGILVGATLTKNRLELRKNSGSVISATVADPQLLRGVRIGSKYSIRVHEKTTRDLITSRETVAELVVGLSPSVEPQSIHSTESSSESRLASENVPEGNDLSKIYQMLKALDEGKFLTPESIGVKTSRWVLYYRASARILDYLTAEGTLTRTGKAVARMRYESFLRQTALQFQISDVGAAWIEWVGAKSISDLKKQQAEEFLLSRAEGLSVSNAKRRAGTLRRWLTVLQPHHSEDSASDDTGREG